MPLVRNILLLGVFVMLLPAEERSPRDQMQKSALRSIEHSATYCERNPRTCETGRELWAEFRSKAEHGLELGARLIQEQLRHAAAPDAARQPSLDEAPLPSTARYAEPRRRQTSLDDPGRWR